MMMSCTDSPVLCMPNRSNVIVMSRGAALQCARLGNLTLHDGFGGFGSQA